MPNPNTNEALRPDNGDKRLIDILRYAKYLSIPVLLTLLAACGAQVSTPDATATAKPAPTDTITASPTVKPTETTAPTETATPEVLGEIFVMAPGAGGEIFATPEGSSEENVGKNYEFSVKVSDISQDVLEKLRQLVKEKVGKFFVFSGSLATETGANETQAINTYALVREDGSVESVAIQSFTVTTGLVKVVRDGVEQDTVAITNFEVGRQTLISEFTPEYIDTLRIKAEKMLGISIDSVKFHVGIRSVDGVVVVGTEADEGADEKNVVALAVPVVDSIVGETFSERGKGTKLDKKSVLELSVLLADGENGVVVPEETQTPIPATETPTVTPPTATSTETPPPTETVTPATEVNIMNHEEVYALVEDLSVKASYEEYLHRLSGIVIDNISPSIDSVGVVWKTSDGQIKYYFDIETSSILRWNQTPDGRIVFATNLEHKISNLDKWTPEIVDILMRAAETGTGGIKFNGNRWLILYTDGKSIGLSKADYEGRIIINRHTGTDGSQWVSSSVNPRARGDVGTSVSNIPSGYTVSIIDGGLDDRQSVIKTKVPFVILGMAAKEAAIIEGFTIWNAEVERVYDVIREVELVRVTT